MQRWLYVLLVFGLLAVSCGSVGDDPVEVSVADVVELDGADVEPLGELPFGLHRCDHDLKSPAADPSLYRDVPVYVGNEMPTDAVRDWAQTKPGYEEIWIDRDHNGWVTVGFSEGVDERQAEIAELFPEDGVVAVHLDWTRQEILSLQQEALAVSGGSGGARIHMGMVDVWVGVLDEEHLAPLAPFAGARLCVEGVLPEDAIVDGPQPMSGEGWRLLGSDRTGWSYRTGVATTEAQYVALWELAGLDGETSIVDFASKSTTTSSNRTSQPLP